MDTSTVQNNEDKVDKVNNNNNNNKMDTVDNNNHHDTNEHYQKQIFDDSIDSKKSIDIRKRPNQHFEKYPPNKRKIQDIRNMTNEFISIWNVDYSDDENFENTLMQVANENNL